MAAKPQFLSKDYLQKTSPAIFAESHDGQRSENYTFISSSRIIDNLDRLGFGVASVRVPNVRKADPLHCRHELNFRPYDDSLSFEDPRMRVINHGQYHLDAAKVFPEIKIVNSSDGSCSFEAMMGMFALICANGLIVAAGMFESIGLRHQYFDAQEAEDLVNEFSGKLPRLAEKLQEWGDIQLSQDQRMDFASNAAKLRWEDPTFDPKLLLNTRREADNGDSLWTTYNVIQENLIQGGFKPGTPKARKVRTLTNISKSNDVNENLWALAETYAN